MTTLGDVPQPSLDPPTDADELNCPLCGYDLRGLPEHRCPECGHAFDPEELRRAKVEKRDWLFEHAGRRLIRSFLTTATRSLWPVGFWKRIRAADVIVTGRLEVWAFTWFVAFNLMLVAGFLIEAGFAYFDNSLVGSFSGPIGRSVANRSFFLTMENLLSERQIVRDVPLLIAAFGWPPIVVLCFQLFGLTLRRAGIHRGHLWRCVLYVWPLMALPLLVAILLTFCFDLNGNSRVAWRYLVVNDPIAQALSEIIPRWLLDVVFVLGFSATTLIATVAAILLSTFHLAAAHVRYLRLPHAIAQAVLIQTVAWLLIVSVIYGCFGG